MHKWCSSPACSWDQTVQHRGIPGQMDLLVRGRILNSELLTNYILPVPQAKPLGFSTHIPSATTEKFVL